MSDEELRAALVQWHQEATEAKASDQPWPDWSDATAEEFADHSLTYLRGIVDFNRAQLDPA